MKATRQELAPGVVQGEFHTSLESGKLRCDVCPRYCTLKEGQRGFCFVREAREGEVVLTAYGRSTGFCVDPIEKKPLNHFFPGTPVMSFGTAGCNLGCRFCQNWDISKAREVEKLSSRAYPEDIAQAALDHGCKSVAFTYNDPVIFLEYAVDTAQACREQDIQSVAVTAGYIGEKARERFYGNIDALNVDLKGFTEDFYHKLCFAHLDPVLDTLRWLKHETNVWFEVTTLLIPGENDSEKEVAELCNWMVDNLGPDVPLHFSAFHPDFKMLDKPRTPAHTLQRARSQGLKAGLNYVYTGNVHDSHGGSTYCPGCSKLLIERDWYQLGEWGLSDEGHCLGCGTKIPGRFDGTPGGWGRQRRPINIL
ncbi:MAG: AmmeMemoRadiSam system radical SAM enzyme [Myxococcota bacterium]|nr:AmmeMemoRadiSam system radical SAM enzyme [Myxococcota bacterium]